MPTKKAVPKAGFDESRRSAPWHDPPQGFVNFFRTYVNGWVAAAVVLPTGVTWKAMPVYESQRGILTTYTALACVLALAFLFYSRDLLTATRGVRSRLGAVGLFLLPLVLIGATGFCGYEYARLLKESAYYAQKPLEEALKVVSMSDVHEGTSIIASYLLAVVFAECALFLMAFREWSPISHRKTAD
jgi:hypothetical protein